MSERTGNETGCETGNETGCETGREAEPVTGSGTRTSSKIVGSLTSRQEELLMKLADAIARRGMAAPAIFFLESSKPMCFIGGQFMAFLDPIIKTFVTIPVFEELPAILEDRSNIDRFMEMIEGREEEIRCSAAGGPEN